MVNSQNLPCLLGQSPCHKIKCLLAFYHYTDLANDKDFTKASCRDFLIFQGRTFTPLGPLTINPTILCALRQPTTPKDEVTGAAYSMAESTMKGLRGAIEGGMDSWTFKDADIGMAYVRRSVMDPESHETVYGPPEQHPIMEDLPMKYSITINEWQKYATLGDQPKNETYMERCYINKTPMGHKIWCLSSMQDHEYIAFYCNDNIIVAEKPIKVLSLDCLMDQK
jgi:hypothetical protein